MTAGPEIAEAPPPNALEGFGEALERRLIELKLAGVEVGPAERMAVNALAIELVGRGAVTDIASFEPYLAAVLGRAPAQSRLFQISDAPESGSEQQEARDSEGNASQKAVGAKPARRESWRIWMAALLGLAIAWTAWLYRDDLGALIQPLSPDPGVAQPANGATGDAGECGFGARACWR